MPPPAPPSAPKPARPTWRLKLTLLVVVSGLCLALAELLLTLLYPQGFSTLYELDERTLFRYRPGAAKTFCHSPENGGGCHQVGINHDGFRGEELLPAGDALRVAVYGDSAVAGEFSELAATFAEQLEDQLEAGTGQPIEAVNAGVVAYGPDQLSLKLEAELPELAPRLVVVVLFAFNDFGDLVRNKLFRLDENGHLVPNDHRLDPWLRAGFGRAPRLLKALVRVKTRLESRRQHLAASERGPEAEHRRLLAWLAARQAEYDDAIVARDPVIRDVLGDTYDADIALEPDSPSAAFKRRLMAAVLGRIAETAARSKVPLLFVIVPAINDVCVAPDFGKVDPALFPRYQPTRLTDTLAQISRGLGVPALDLYPPFSAAGADDLFLAGGDSHWNDAGQALAARLTAERILERALLPARRPGP